MSKENHIKTLKVKVKDRHFRILRRMSCRVNNIWNLCNEVSSHAILRADNDGKGVFLSGYDLQKYTKGKAEELGIHSATIQMVGQEYATRRNQFKKPILRWRKSQGVGRSLGWIPIRKDCAKLKEGKIKYNGKSICINDSYGLSEYKFKQSSFNEDARGKWYFNVVVEVQKVPLSLENKEAIGIDLGLKRTVTCSNGDILNASNFYRKSQQKLAVAQRANKKKLLKTIHANVKNSRKDSLHKFANKIVAKASTIIVGDVKAREIAKTNLAKSVHDSGWYMLKAMLDYKCDHAGVVFKEISEKYTTQTCSNCGKICCNSPKGRAGLLIREWTCNQCITLHDRDVNAAKNILALGLESLNGGIPHYSTCV